MSEENQVCPFLGLLDDAETLEAFPSNWNYCHHSRPVLSPSLRYQGDVCLSEKHASCPVFLSQNPIPLPKQMRAPRARKGWRQNSLLRNLIIGLAALILVTGFAWMFRGRQLFAAPVPGTATQATLPARYFTVTKTPFQTATASPLPTMTLTITPRAFSGFTDTTATPTYTPTKYVTLTASSTPSAYDVLIGTDYKFVIHKVVTGESLETLAARYNTSVEAIVSINYGMDSNSVAWVDTVLVIPVDFKDTTRLPRFVTYEVQKEQRGITVEDMAKLLRVNPLDLKYYNGWTRPGDRPLVGQLLLVPRPRLQP